MIIEEAKKAGKKFDLIVYSLASPVRSDPDKIDPNSDTGAHVLYKSVIKPIGKTYAGLGIDILTDTLKETAAEPANEDEIANTVKVMGGEDWALWIDQLAKADVLSEGIKTVAYSYIGPSLSYAIYRDGTIGEAKKHLERTAKKMDAELQASLKGKAYISVNKGVVSRLSVSIPIIALYLSVLFKVMKKKGTHEGCIEQMERLFAERLYTGDAVPTDNVGRIRIDDLEMDPKVQEEVKKRMATITQENFTQVGDLVGYRHDFLVTNGFDVEGVDYTADVASMESI